MARFVGTYFRIWLPDAKGKTRFGFGHPSQVTLQKLGKQTQCAQCLAGWWCLLKLVCHFTCCLSLSCWEQDLRKLFTTPFEGNIFFFDKDSFINDFLGEKKNHNSCPALKEIDIDGGDQPRVFSVRVWACVCSWVNWGIPGSKYLVIWWT